MPGKPDAQTGLFDRTIEWPELEDAIETLVTAREDGTLKAISKARALVKAVVEDHALQDGERLRCGAFVITGRERAGGGFEVPTWSKVTVGAIVSLDDES